MNLKGFAYSIGLSVGVLVSNLYAVPDVFELRGACSMSLGKLPSLRKGLWNSNPRHLIGGLQPARPFLYDSNARAAIKANEFLKRRDLGEILKADREVLLSGMTLSSYSTPATPNPPDVSEQKYQLELSRARKSLADQRETAQRAQGDPLGMESYYREQVILLERGYVDWKARATSEYEGKNGAALEFKRWTSNVMSTEATQQWDKFLEILGELNSKRSGFMREESDLSKSIRAFFRWGLEKYILADEILPLERVKRARNLSWSGTKFGNIFGNSADPLQLEYALILRLPEKDEFFKYMAEFLEKGGAVYAFGDREYSYSDDSRRIQESHNIGIVSAVFRNAALHYEIVFEGTDFYKQIWMNSSLYPRLADKLVSMDVSPQFDPNQFTSDWNQRNIELFLAPFFSAPSSELGTYVRQRMKRHLSQNVNLLETEAVGALYNSQPEFAKLIEEVVSTQ